MFGCLVIQEKQGNADKALKRNVAVLMGKKYCTVDVAREDLDDTRKISRDDGDSNKALEYLLINRDDNANDAAIDDFITMTREIGSDSIATAIFMRILHW
jgi:hypothetical protein